MAKTSSKKLTKYVPSSTIITAEAANTWYGGLYGSPDGSLYEEGDPQVAGHIHDGKHQDGHAQKIDLSDHVTGKLQNSSIANGAINTRTVAKSTTQDDAIPEYRFIDGDKYYYLDLSKVRDDFAFARDSDVISNSPGDMAVEDFVFGSDQLEDDGDSDHYSRFYFDKSKGAFRSGIAEGSQWDTANVGQFSTVFGKNNRSDGEGSTIAGGLENVVISTGDYCFIGSGYSNRVESEYSTILSGYDNQINAPDGYSSILGGHTNTISGSHASIAGGEDNSISAAADYSFIGSGYSNAIFGSHSSIASGYDNSISAAGDYSFVGSGYNNRVESVYSAILGGYDNEIDAADGYSSILGGYGNLVSGDYSSIISGQYNEITSVNNSAILAGTNNTSSGQYGVIIGGKDNIVTGSYSMAHGINAKAISYGERAFSSAETVSGVSGCTQEINLIFSKLINTSTSGNVTLYCDAISQTGIIPSNTSIYLSCEFLVSEVGSVNSYGYKKDFLITADNSGVPTIEDTGLASTALSTSSNPGNCTWTLNASASGYDPNQWFIYVTPSGTTNAQTIATCICRGIKNTYS